MKNRKAITNLSLFLILCSCFAAGCGSGGNKTAGDLTEQNVKDYFTNYHMKNCDQFYECKVIFETPVEIGFPVRQSITGAMPPPDGGLPIVYPVNVDVSYYKRNIDANGIGMWTRYKGGVHYFCRDANNIWNDAPSGVDMKFENDDH